MKYRDIITLFLTILLILSIAYVFGVDQSLWYVPVVIFIIFVFFIYKLWIEK